jgi:hypothetical protein
MPSDSLVTGFGVWGMGFGEKILHHKEQNPSYCTVFQYIDFELTLVYYFAPMPNTLVSKMYSSMKKTFVFQ